MKTDYSNEVRRGKPNTGEGVLTHFKAERIIGREKIGCYDSPFDSLCRNGSYHIFWTTVQSAVTCPKCKELLEKGVTKIDLRNH